MWRNRYTSESNEEFILALRDFLGLPHSGYGKSDCQSNGHAVISRKTIFYSFSVNDLDGGNRRPKRDRRVR